MSISLLRNKIQQYFFNYPEEEEIIAQVFEFLDNQIDCFSRSNLYGHFTGSAWVVDETNNWVLMTHHYQLNKWLQLGGHADGNENLLDVAMNEAIEDSGLNEDEISNNMTGLIMGSGGPSTKSLLRAFDITREKGPKKIGPTSVPKVMCSTNSATLSTYFKIKGINYSISSACSTSAHCIGLSLIHI